MPTVDVDVYILGDHVDDTSACVRSIQAGLMQSRADGKPVTGNHSKVMMASVLNLEDCVSIMGLGFSNHMIFA